MAYTSVVSGRRSGSAPGVLHSLVNAITTASSANTHKQFQLDRCYSNFGLQVTGATSAADKIELEASLNGADWGTVAGSTFILSSNAAGTIKWVTSKPALYIRAVAKSLPSTVATNAYIAPGL